jgi:rSAM/selenodomain-associated transferase 1
MSAPPETLVIFARAPRTGTVKTRLAASIGDVGALAIYRSLCEGTIAMARSTGLSLTVAFTPPDAIGEMREWLGDDLQYEAQCEGDLGARLADTVARHSHGGARCIAVIGTDCPTITAATVHAALATLSDADVVFGPASDGGYYLVAMRGAHVTVFHDVPWSSPSTLAVTLARASDAGLRVAMLDVESDIDTIDDWTRYQASPR